MRVVLSAPPKYHFFDLGRQLVDRGYLTALMTGYPRYKLKSETKLAPYFQTIPYFHVVYRALVTSTGINLEFRDKVFFDDQVARRMPECDIFMGIAASFLESAKKAKSMGAGVIVDRPCSHIVEQDRLLQDESKREGIKLPPIDPRVIDREVQEYEFADLITVPSNFAARSFYAKGFSADKIRVIPYGVDVSVFQPVATPDPETFEVLFVGQLSLRKGLVHLIRAFEKVKHPRKKLTLIGSAQREMLPTLRREAARLPIEILGHVPQSQLKESMSRSHVFVLPSIEDGYGLVMSQAMACGCPVVATANTGAEMLISEGVEGYIVPAADSNSIAERLQRLADDPSSRESLSQAALRRIERLAGWSGYCDQIVAMFNEVRS